MLTRYVHRFRGAAPSPAAAPAAMNLQWAPDPSVGWRLKGSGVGLWPRLSQPDSSSWASEGEQVNPKSKRRLEWAPCETGCSVTAIDTEKKHTQLSSAEKTVTRFTESTRARAPVSARPTLKGVCRSERKDSNQRHVSDNPGHKTHLLGCPLPDAPLSRNSNRE